MIGQPKGQSLLVIIHFCVQLPTVTFHSICRSVRLTTNNVLKNVTIHNAFGVIKGNIEPGKSQPNNTGAYKTVAEYRGSGDASSSLSSTIFFVFMLFSRKIGRIIDWRLRLWDWRPCGKSWIRQC